MDAYIIVNITQICNDEKYHGAYIPSQYKPGKIHFKKEEAEREVKRLVLANKGQKFAVFKLVNTFICANYEFPAQHVGDNTEVDLDFPVR